MTGCTVLLAPGRNPVSGRARTGPAEAAAVSMAQRAGLTPRLLHAGGGAGAMLARGLGLGAARLDLLEIGAEDDPVPALAAALSGALAGQGAGLILTGPRAETGEGSGMVPYLLGAALGLPVLDECLALRREGGALVAIRRAGPGTRQVIALPDRAILVASAAAPPAALGRLIRDPAALCTRHAADAPHDARHDIPPRPARRMPPPIGPAAATETGGAAIGDAEAGAAAMLDVLDKAGLLPPAGRR